MNVSIGEEFARLIQQKVESGRYASAREVVEEGLRALERAESGDEKKLAWLRQAWDQGVASGNVGRLHAEELKREARRRRGKV